MQPGQQPNPFLTMLQHMKQGGQPQAPGQPAPQPQAPQQPAAGIPGGAVKPQDTSKFDVTQYGSNPGSSTGLIKAMSLLQGSIGEMTNPQQITKLRAIINLLTSLITEDQVEQQKNMGKFNQQQPQVELQPSQLQR